MLADACSWREVRVEAIDDGEPRARVSTVVVGDGTRARVPRPQPRAPCRPRGVDPRLSGPSARRGGHPGGARAAAGARWTRRRGRSSVRRWSTSCATSAPWSEPRERGTGRGAGAPAPGHARGRRRRRAALRRARGVRSAARRSCSKRRRPTRCPPRAPTRSVRWSSRGAARRRWGSRAARICASSRRSRAHVGLGSGTKLALAVAQALATLHGRTVDAPGLAEAVGRAARSAVGMWTFALGGLVVEGGVRRGVERPAPLLARHARARGVARRARRPAR